IEPEGFNDPNDLITSVTYVKAPEFTRMIETSLGKPVFAWALDLYHRKFAGSNASPSDWLRVMEDVGKTDFSIMASRWLKETGYPVVSATCVWNAELSSADITVTQKGYKEGKPWIFPFTGKLIGENGDVLAEFMHKIDAGTITFSVPCPGPVAFALWNINHAAYIRMERDESDELLYRELLFDKNPVSKFLTFLTLYEREMIRLLEDEQAVPSEQFGDVFMQMLEDSELTASCGALPFTMFEAVSDDRFEYAHTALYQAKQKILRSIAGRYEIRLRLLYEAIPDAMPEGFVPKDLAVQFKRNAVRNLILTVLSSLNTQDTQFLAKHQFTSAVSSTNRLAALTLYLSSSAPGRMETVAQELERTAGNPVAFENFIAAVAGSFSPDTVEYLKLIEASPYFHKEQSGESRSLYLRFSQNRKLSIETEAGRKFLENAITGMAGINSYLTTGMLSVFSHMNRYDNLLRTELYALLTRIEAAISPVTSPAVYQTVKQLLAGAFGNE
ncbi:MAG TPA: aminopeptidase N C-terminal domain-containing protein, partial [Methanocorpusculum sp.]|nr:aminopeptidase N C-terminal domain-containing protein [Methanocorpusculum sp.]